MKILFVNHTFPPESTAGSELCVLNLAKEFQRRGQETAVFYRYGDPADDEYEVRSGTYETVPVYKINNTFRFARLFQDIYLNSAVAAKFARLLGEFRPDVVHFHHLTNLSLSLVTEAKTYGSQVVVTLHDYWLLCQRGQLLKRDLSLCHGPSDEACRSCLAAQLLRGKAQRWVSRLWKVGRGAGTVVNRACDLLDLSRARINTPQREFVGLATFDLGDRPGETLLTHPPAEIRYPIRLHRAARLETAIAMHPSTYACAGGGVSFEILRNDTPIFSQILNPKQDPTHRGWREVIIPLPASERTEDCLALRTTSENPANNLYCAAGWRKPTIEYTEPAESPPPISERRSEIHRLLVQAAGLAADAIAAFSGQAEEGISHRKHWTQKVVEQTDLFLSPSRFLRDFFIAHGFPSDRILFSDNGFLPSSSPARRGCEQPLRFGYIGTWIPSKGVDLALKAFRNVDPASARLIVHGFFPGYDGYEDYEGRLRALAGPAVEFRGKYEPGSVHVLLAEMDCLIMPSIWWENSPMTIHEAFQAHVPVITADVGGMAEQVRYGGGLTFRHRDADSLRGVIERILRAPRILDDLRATIPGVKSVKQHADELLELYAGLLHRRRPL